jgi:hypothetical protein
MLPVELGSSTPRRKEYRIQAMAVLLTYNGFGDDIEQWLRFLSFVQARLRQWTVKHWCATLEAGQGEWRHAHLMLQFHQKVDRTTVSFKFDGKLPNASSTDLCGEGFGRKKPQQSIDRGMFYVWADKIGTCRDPDGNICVSGNYWPCWTEHAFRYQVLGAWPEKLWKQRKLSSETYRRYLYLTRDGVPTRKRNFDEVALEEDRLLLQADIAANTKRLRSNPALYQPFPVVPEAVAWLELFKADALRYPLLIVMGPSMCGKTEWSKSLFKNALELKVGTLTYLPDGLRAFDRNLHDGLVLDDVRDLKFLTDNQDKLQGKYDAELEFAVTPGGLCKYTKYLFKVPTVVTINHSTANLDYLKTHDWLNKPGNRKVVNYKGPA